MAPESGKPEAAAPREAVALAVDMVGMEVLPRYGDCAPHGWSALRQLLAFTAHATQQGLVLAGDVYVPTLIRTRIRAVPTRRNALIPPCLADVERQRLAVLRDVGRHSIIADTAICEEVWIARIIFGIHGGYAGLLEADEGALGALVGAPCIWMGVSWWNERDDWGGYSPRSLEDTLSGSMR